MAGSVGSLFSGETDTSVDPRADGGAQQGFEQEDPGGKYLLLGLNGFPNPVDASAPTMASYIRLGTPAAGAGQATATVFGGSLGEDLASLVQGFTDDFRERGPSGDPAINPQFSPPQQSADGTPFADPGAAGGLTTKQQRQHESSQLHTRGGWRDHTDGNRITTTRGDKVEVIRGNYKLLVLGRAMTTGLANTTEGFPDDDARKRAVQGGCGIEMSGGCIDTDSGDLSQLDGARPGTNTPLSVEYTWHQDSDGHWYWLQMTNQGSPAASPYGNGQIISNTWVDYQETNLGSFLKPVNAINASTYAITMQSITNVAGASSTTTTVGGELSTQEIVGGNMSDVVLASTVTDVKCVAGAMAELDAAAGAILLAQVAEVIATTLNGLVVDLHDGAHIDTHLGAHTDTHVGSHVETHALLHTDTHTAAHIDTHEGIHLDVHSGPHYDLSSGLNYTAEQMGITVSRTHSLAVSQNYIVQVMGMHVSTALVHHHQ
jgi:hypothetical protein